MRRIFAWMSLGVVVFAFVAPSLPHNGPVVLLAFLFIGAYATVGVPVLFWPCPRCRRFYSSHFGLMAISWPWFDQCLHCGAELVKEPREDS
jgi:hypothetical protein